MKPKKECKVGCITTNREPPTVTSTLTIFRQIIHQQGALSPLIMLLVSFSVIMTLIG